MKQPESKLWEKIAERLRNGQKVYQDWLGTEVYNREESSKLWEDEGFETVAVWRVKRIK
jgi:hypothetical protein